MGTGFSFYLLIVIVQGTIGKTLVTFLDINRDSTLLKFTIELNLLTISVRIHIMKSQVKLLGQVDIIFPHKI